MRTLTELGDMWERDLIKEIRARRAENAKAAEGYKEGGEYQTQILRIVAMFDRMIAAIDTVAVIGAGHEKEITMSHENDTPAFPSKEINHKSGQLETTSGMTLRQHYAGIAIGALITAQSDLMRDHDGSAHVTVPCQAAAAVIAVQFADALIEELAK